MIRELTNIRSDTCQLAMESDDALSCSFSPCLFTICCLYGFQCAFIPYFSVLMHGNLAAVSGVDGMISLYDTTLPSESKLTVVQFRHYSMQAFQPDTSSTGSATAMPFSITHGATAQTHWYCFFLASSFIGHTYCRSPRLAISSAGFGTLKIHLRFLSVQFVGHDARSIIICVRNFGPTLGASKPFDSGLWTHVCYE